MTCRAQYYDGRKWHWCERKNRHPPYHEYALESGDIVQFDGHGHHMGIRAEVVMDTKEEAAANEAARIRSIEDLIRPILEWPLENRLMLLWHMRMLTDMEHISTHPRDLEVGIARERKKK